MKISDRRFYENNHVTFAGIDETTHISPEYTDNIAKRKMQIRGIKVSSASSTPSTTVPLTSNVILPAQPDDVLEENEVFVEEFQEAVGNIDEEEDVDNGNTVVPDLNNSIDFDNDQVDEYGRVVLPCRSDDQYIYDVMTADVITDINLVSPAPVSVSSGPSAPVSFSSLPAAPVESSQTLASVSDVLSVTPAPVTDVTNVSIPTVPVVHSPPVTCDTLSPGPSTLTNVVTSHTVTVPSSDMSTSHLPLSSTLPCPSIPSGHNQMSEHERSAMSVAAVTK